MSASSSSDSSSSLPSSSASSSSASSASASSSSPGKLPRGVWLLGLTSFFTDFGSEMIFPLVPVFLVGLGAAPWFYGLVEGAAELVAMALKLVAGITSDKMGKKKPLVVAGYALAAFVRPLTGLALFPWHVLVVRAADRVGKGLRSAPRDALLSSLVDDKNSGRAFGVHRAMDHAGAVVGPLAAAVLLHFDVDIRTVFLVAFAPGILSVVSTLLVREPSTENEGVVVSDAALTVTEPASTTKSPISRAEKRFFFAVTVFSLGRATEGFLLLRLSELGLRDALIPLAWAFLHVVKVISSAAGGVLADKVNRVTLLAVAWSMAAGTALLLALATRPDVLIALLVLVGVHQGLSEPVEKSIVKALTKRERVGRAFGLYHVAGGVSLFVASVGIGALWTMTNASVALAFPALTSVIAVAMLLRARTSAAPTPRA